MAPSQQGPKPLNALPSLQNHGQDANDSVNLFEHPGGGPMLSSSELKAATEPVGVGGVTFEIEEGAPSPHARTGYNQAPWYHAAFHTVTAVVGAGVLGLPYAFSYLTWTGGVLMLLLAGSTSLYTSYLMAAMHEKDGVRYNRYRDLGEAVMGRRNSRLFIAPFQFIVMVGLGVAYALTGGQSLHYIDVLTNGSLAGVDPLAPAAAQSSLPLTAWIFIFGFAMAALAQLPNFHSLAWVSVVGALMSIGYAAIAFLTSLARTRTVDADYGPRDTGWNQVHGIFSAIGAITFAYGGHSVLLEIQATLKAPPPPKDSMMRGVVVAYIIAGAAYFGVASAGYAAYGRDVNADVLLSLQNPRWLIAIANFMVVLHVAASYQVFSMPVFEAVETTLQRRISALSGREHFLRLGFRTLYVLLTAFVAASLPFFGEIMGFIGAIGFVPMTFVMPSVLWLIARPDRPLWDRALNWSIIVVFTTLGVFALIGASALMHKHASEYEFFS